MYRNVTWLVVPFFFLSSVHLLEGSFQSIKDREVERSAREIEVLNAIKRGDLTFVKNNLTVIDCNESDDKVRVLDEALLCACALGHKDIARMLIHLGAQVNIITTEGTPVSIAAKAGHADIIELLVDYDADVNEPRVFPPDEDELSGSPLHLCCEDRVLREEHLPIIIAARKGDFSVTKTLINAGASVNVYGRVGSPLKEVIAAAYQARSNDPKASLSDYIKTLKLLIRAGADHSLTDESDLWQEESPLYFAVDVCFTDMVKVLLKEGAAPNTVRFYSKGNGEYDSIKVPVLWTVIEKTAFEDGSIEIIKLLLEAGADAQYQFGALRRAMRLAPEYKPVEKTNYLLGLSYLLYPTPKSSHERIYWALRSLRPLFPPYVVVEILCSEKSLVQDVINFFLIELKEGRGSFILDRMQGDKDSQIRWILFSVIKEDLISYLEKNGVNRMDSCWEELGILEKTPWNRDDTKKPEEVASIIVQLKVARSSVRTLISQGIEDRCKELENKARAERSLLAPATASSIMSAASINNKKARITAKRRIMII